VGGLGAGFGWGIRTGVATGAVGETGVGGLVLPMGGPGGMVGGGFTGGDLSEIGGLEGGQPL